MQPGSCALGPSWVCCALGEESVEPLLSRIPTSVLICSCIHLKEPFSSYLSDSAHNTLLQVYPQVKQEPPSPTPKTSLPTSTAAGNLPSIATASPHPTPKPTTSAAAATTSATGQGSRGTAAVGSNSEPISFGGSGEESEDEESDYSSRGDPEEYDVDDSSEVDELASAVEGQQLAGAVKAEPMDIAEDGGASSTGFGVAGGGSLQKLAQPSQLRGILKREQSDTGPPAGPGYGGGGETSKGEPSQLVRGGSLLTPTQADPMLD